MNPKPRRYAEGTSIAVEQTQGQINTLVRRHGADMCSTGWLAS